MSLGIDCADARCPCGILISPVLRVVDLVSYDNRCSAKSLAIFRRVIRRILAAEINSIRENVANSTVELIVRTRDTKEEIVQSNNA